LVNLKGADHLKDMRIDERRILELTLKTIDHYSAPDEPHPISLEVSLNIIVQLILRVLRGPPNSPSLI